MKNLTPFGYLATVLLVSSLVVLSLASISDMGSAQDSEDFEFLGWYNTTMAKIETDTINMAVAIENYDCVTCEAWAVSGYEDATKALAEMEGYEISPELQPVKDHLKLALGDFKVACEHTECGAKMYDADELEAAARYVESSLGHFEEIDELGLVPPTPVVALSRLQGDLEQAVQTLGSSETPTTSPTPTPKSPSYEALLAVGGLLAVAYLVRRRK
jgi:hypothetical protein